MAETPKFENNTDPERSKGHMDLGKMATRAAAERFDIDFASSMKDYGVAATNPNSNPVKSLEDQPADPHRTEAYLEAEGYNEFFDQAVDTDLGPGALASQLGGVTSHEDGTYTLSANNARHHVTAQGIPIDPHPPEISH